jgi:hypothetical protein
MYLYSGVIMLDAAPIAFLLEAAVAHSGYTTISVESLPPMRAVTRNVIATEICPKKPEECQGIVAVFDTDGYRILYSEELDTENAADNSFLIHELVHVLQHKANGDKIFASCEAAMKTETEAYRAQNAYLKKEGQFLRFGETLAFTTCSGAQNTFFTPEMFK